jgi:hypothetical protein
MIDQIINARKKRWLDFYNPQEPASHLFIIHYAPELGTRPWPRLDLKQNRIEWAWQKYQIQLQLLDWLDDDSLPFLDVYTGTEIFAQAFGCPVVYPDNEMPFAQPLIHSANEVSALRIPNFGSTPLAVLFEIADELRRRSGPRALVKLVDVQSPMDIAALIWDKVSFYTALHDTPGVVLELARKVGQFLTEFLDEWFRRYGHEFIAHFPDYYMPGGITLSEDEVGSVSVSMFNDYFLPELSKLSAHFGGIGMHCCANARHQWDNFLKIPNLRMLNLGQPPEIIREAWAFFADHTAQTHRYAGEEPAWTWPDQYPVNSRILMNITVDNLAQAFEVSSKLRARQDRIISR